MLGINLIRTSSRFLSFPNTRFLRFHRKKSEYSQIFDRSIEKPIEFWKEAGEEISWIKKPESTFQKTGEKPWEYRWFGGGTLNTCYNALDLHISKGCGDKLALIYDSPVTGTVQSFTFKELHEKVTRCAGMLSNLGVVKGDRVVIYNPMIPETCFAMLACARLGAIHSVVFGGFSSEELANRINDAKPKVVVSASCGIEKGKPVPYKVLLDKAIDLVDCKPQNCVIFQRRDHLVADLIEGRDLDWEEQMEKATPYKEVVPVSSDDPLYILYTSGTTGKPKGVVRDNGGHSVALKWSMKNIFGMEEKDEKAWWAASDFGWVVGHSYILYAPLLHGNTTVLYEGKPVGTPDSGAFWNTISKHNVKSLFCAPTTIRAIKKEDPNTKNYEKYDMKEFEGVFLAGERADPDTIKWLEAFTKKPVIDNWWMTETGWPITANPKGLGYLPVKYGSGGKAMPGYNIEVLSDDGKVLSKGKEGNIVIKHPLPPGFMIGLWKDEKRFKGYMERDGYFSTGDYGVVDEQDYITILSRQDDIIKVAAHRLSTGTIEEAISSHPDVAECCVFAIKDDVKGEVPFGVVTLKDRAQQHDSKAIEKEICEYVRNKLGAVYQLKKCMVVKSIPKTRSGKVLRRVLKQISNGEEFKIPATIEDPSSLDSFKELLISSGYHTKSAE